MRRRAQKAACGPCGPAQPRASGCAARQNAREQGSVEGAPVHRKKRTTKRERRRTFEVRGLALGDLVVALDALDRAVQGDAHATGGEVAIAKPVQVVDRDGEVGLVGRERVAVDLQTLLVSTECAERVVTGVARGRARRRTAAMGMARRRRSPFESG